MQVPPPPTASHAGAAAAGGECRAASGTLRRLFLLCKHLLGGETSVLDARADGPHTCLYSLGRCSRCRALDGLTHVIQLSLLLGECRHLGRCRLALSHKLLALDDELLALQLKRLPLLEDIVRLRAKRSQQVLRLRQCSRLLWKWRRQRSVRSAVLHAWADCALGRPRYRAASRLLYDSKCGPTPPSRMSERSHPFRPRAANQSLPARGTCAVHTIVHTTCAVTASAGQPFFLRNPIPHLLPFFKTPLSRPGERIEGADQKECA